MKAKKIVKTTTNRDEFNRAYKYHLANKGKIGCAYCRYHKGENDGKDSYYIDYSWLNGKLFNSRPNWKLATKNRKQWMNKKYKTKTYTYYSRYDNDFISYKKILVRNDY